MRHLYSMTRALEAIWSKRPENPEAGHVIISDREMTDAIVSFVTDFGHVSTLLFDDGPKRTSENAVTYRIRKERTERVADFFGGIDTEVFKDRRIRNRHFHADEYVAKLLAKHPDAVIIKDLSVSDRAAMSSPTLPLIYVRVYEYANDVLLHLDAEFDVKKLYEAGLLMVERLREAA